LESEAINISVVIPTIDRADSLQRTLTSLLDQSYMPKEIIVVDASDDPIDMSQCEMSDSCSISVIHSKIASVCIQRNIGIRQAIGNYIFICDDDIQVSKNYLSEIAHYFKNNQDEVIVTGRVLEKDKNEYWNYRVQEIKFPYFIWSYVFLHSIWIDIETYASYGYWIKKLVSLNKRLRSNDVSLAGWPLMSSASPNGITKCTITGLGASVVRADWLKNHLYDEVLDAHGIGDNYGVAIQLGVDEQITILEKSFVYHHKETTNRLRPELAYFRRTLALHYFMKRSNRYGWSHLIF